MFLLLFSLILALSNIALSSPITTIEHRSIDQIYQAALEESRLLTVAWGGDITASQALAISAFQESFPKIKLVFSSDLSKYCDSDIDIAHSSSGGSSDKVDVAVLQSVHDFPRWKQEGRLLNYKVKDWLDFYPEFVDPDGAYTGMYIFSLGSLVYTPAFQSLLPSHPTVLSLPSLLSPPLSDHLKAHKIALTYPNDDDAVLYLFVKLIQHYGWGIMESLQNQNATWVRGTATAAMVMANHYSKSPKHHSSYLDSVPRPIVSFATDPAFAPKGSLLSSSPFSHTNSLTYESDYITWPQTAAIFSSSRNQETAKLFLSFLASPQHQLAMNSSGFATRRSFDSKGIFDQSPFMDGTGYQEFMSDRENVEAWRLKFEYILGLPKGRNPNHIDF